MFTYFANAHNVLLLSTRVLVGGLVMLVVGIYGAYLYSGNLPIAFQVFMHAMTIVGPTLIKVGYVMRLLAQHRLSKRAFI